MKSIYPFVVLENCKEEIEYYRSIFGGEIRILSEKEDKVLQSELHVGNILIHFADATAANPTVKGDYVKVMLNFESEEEIRKAYEALNVGGHVNIAIYETPFNALIAAVTDRNGIGWVLRYFRT
jgi:PhnB protein